MVKVTEAGRTVPSDKSLLDRPIVTSAIGSVFNASVNVAVAPASVVCPLIEDTVTPGESLSSLITVTSDGLTLL